MQKKIEIKKIGTVEEMFEKLMDNRKLRISVTRKSFKWFFLFYFREHMTCKAAPFHDDLFRIGQDDKISLAVIIAFRGSAKSTILSTAYTLWSILGIHQKKFVILSGQTEENARQGLLNIKAELENNERLRKDLGPFEEERDQWGSTALVIKQFNAKIIIRSVGQHIRGLKHHHYRPDLIIIDDVEDTDSVRTKEGRQKTWEWLTSEALPAGDTNTRIIAIGNLLHEDSLLKKLIRQIQNKALPGEYLEIPIITADGKSAWPGKYPSLESIDEKRRSIMDEIAWSREYLLKIISHTERVVHPEWIQYYDDLPYGNPNYIVISVDLAISEKESADCTAMVVGYIYGYGNDTKIYIQPYPVNERLTFPAQVERIKVLEAIYRQKCNTIKFYIEDVAYQKAMIQILEQGRYDVIAVTTGGSDKTARLRLATPMMKDGRILFPRTGCGELIMQLTGFGKEYFDDLADAFAYLVIKTVEENRRIAIFAEKIDLL